MGFLFCKRHFPLRLRKRLLSLLLMYSSPKLSVSRYLILLLLLFLFYFRELLLSFYLRELLFPSSYRRELLLPFCLRELLLLFLPFYLRELLLFLLLICGSPKLGVPRRLILLFLLLPPCRRRLLLPLCFRELLLLFLPFCLRKLLLFLLPICGSPKLGGPRRLILLLSLPGRRRIVSLGSMLEKTV